MEGPTLTRLHTPACPLSYPPGSAVWPLHQLMSYPRANSPPNSPCTRNFLWIHREFLSTGQRWRGNAKLISLSSWCVAPRVSSMNMPLSPPTSHTGPGPHIQHPPRPTHTIQPLSGDFLMILGGCGEGARRRNLFLNCVSQFLKGFFFFKY